MPDIHAGTSPIPHEWTAPRHSEAVDISVADHVFTNATTCLHVGTTGDIEVEEMGQPGQSTIYYNVDAGTFLGRFTKIIRAGTTADDIVGRW